MVTGSMNDGFVVTNKQIEESGKDDEHHQEVKDIEKEDGNLNDDSMQDGVQNDSNIHTKEENVKVEIKGEAKGEAKPQTKEEKKQAIGAAGDKKEDRQSVNTSDVQLRTLWISAAVVSFLIVIVLAYKYKINRA